MTFLDLGILGFSINFKKFTKGVVACTLVSISEINHFKALTSSSYAISEGSKHNFILPKPFPHELLSVKAAGYGLTDSLLL